ncbi:MAG: hypothetical protein Ct9H90mP20_0700 [Candidatus Neomarinimicrobiota bacterium]|nr:MAG: hypothetical protein Ct9H90mP20_0700 [Candidatus Neomarinimicrobiota bacterium]
MLKGQRRYVESLSSYARQFLGLMEKPDIDYIKGVCHPQYPLSRRLQQEIQGQQLGLLQKYMTI